MPAFHVARAFARAMPFCALMLTAAFPASAYEAVTPGQILTGQPGRAILSDPAAKLRWDTPAQSWWAIGEALPIATSQQDAASYRASVAFGGRHELLASSGVSWTILPQLRVDAAGGPDGSAGTPALGASLLQEAAVSLPGGARFLASFGIGDSLKISAPGGDARGAPNNLAVRAAASLASVLGSVAGAPLRAELQFVAARKVASENWTEPSSSCELKLELSQPNRPPLRLASACPGSGAPTLTIGISGRF